MLLNVFRIYGHGGHLGHMTKRFKRKRCLKIYVYSPGAGADNPLAFFFFKY